MKVTKCRIITEEIDFLVHRKEAKILFRIIKADIPKIGSVLIEGFTTLNIPIN